MDHIKKQAENTFKLNERIKKAIEDETISTSEYEKILHLADEDGVIDASEQRMLSELNDLIQNGTIKKIPG